MMVGAERLPPLLRPYRVVNPRLNRACVQAIVVVVATTVAPAVADIGHEPASRAVRRSAQENAAARISKTDVARYRPESPRFIDDPPHRGGPDPSLAVPSPFGHRDALFLR